MSNDARGLVSEVSDLFVRPSPSNERRLRDIAALDPELLTRIVTLAKKTRAMIIEHTWPNQSARVVAEIDELVRLLQDESTSVLELLLVESVVTSYVRLLGVEQYYIAATFHKAVPRSMANFWDKTLNEAQKRFLRAAHTLATIRRLAARTPQLQMNIANQQVNVLEGNG